MSKKKTDSKNAEALPEEEEEKKERGEFFKSFS